MYQDQFVFSQIMTHLPWTTFDRCVQRYRGNRKVRSFRCSQQFRAMAIAQLTHRTSLREIEICLRAHAEKLYHLGFPNGISKSTLAKANEKRNWHIYADFAQRLIASARRLHTHEDFQMDLDQTVYALDSSTIDLCLSLFPWARFRTTKSGIKINLSSHKFTCPGLLSTDACNATEATARFARFCCNSFAPWPSHN